MPKLVQTIIDADNSISQNNFTVNSDLSYSPFKNEKYLSQLEENAGTNIKKKLCTGPIPAIPVLNTTPETTMQQLLLMRPVYLKMNRMSMVS